MSLRLSQVAHYFVKHSFSRSIAVLKRDNWKALMFLGYTLVVSFSLQPASWTSSQNEFTDFIIDQNGNHEWHGNQPPGPAVNYRRHILHFRTPHSLSRNHHITNFKKCINAYWRGYMRSPLSIPGVYDRNAANAVSNTKPKFSAQFL